MQYACVCGENFTNLLNFKAHRRTCQNYLIKRYGSLEAYEQLCMRLRKQGQKLKKASEISKQQAEVSWIASQPRCKNCNKIMLKKFGSGLYCSRSCANTRSPSEETKAKIGQESVKSREVNIQNLMATLNLCANSAEHPRSVKEVLYMQNPRKCPICFNDIPYHKRRQKTCSSACGKLLLSKTMRETLVEKGLHCTAAKKYKYGRYQGIPCDSSWELAYLLYHLDKGIKIQRNSDSFTYVFENVTHLYFPDFLLADGTYVEIKNYYSEQVVAKIEQFPQDLKLQVIDRKAIQPFLKYAEDTYGKAFWKMYDKDSKSCNS